VAVGMFSNVWLPVTPKKKGGGVRRWEGESLLCLLQLLFSCDAIFYSGALLQVIGRCLGMTLFTSTLVPLAVGHGDVICMSVLGGEHTRGCRLCCTSADCTKQSSSCVDISVSSSIKSLCFSPLYIDPTWPAVTQKGSLRVSVSWYKTLYKMWMQNYHN
jgi:hypothetical protein